MKPRQTAGKRIREKDRAEKQQLKAERKKLRKLDRDSRSDDFADGEDPDIAGIEPGPQKLDPVLFGLLDPRLADNSDDVGN